MGAGLSCLDPAREHPPFSWPKDHPGRAEAIAEYKARRSATKFKKKAAAKPAVKEVEEKVEEKVVEKVPAPTEKVEVVDSKPAPVTDDVSAVGEKKAAENLMVVPTADDAKEVEPEVAEKVIEDGTVDPAPEVEEKVIDETVEETAVPTEKVEPEGVPEEITEVQDVVAEPVAPHPETEVSAPAEDISASVVEKSAEPTIEETPVEAEATLEPEPTPELEADLVPASSAAAEAETYKETGMGPVSGAIDDRRAIFENKPDTLPAVTGVARDVQDPVTGEFVTLSEYRKRQRERAQGVVKEHVDKFEHLDEVALKEKAIKKLQIESRQKTVRSWTQPDSSSTPSSPIEPRKTGDLALPAEAMKK